MNYFINLLLLTCNRIIKPVLGYRFLAAFTEKRAQLNGTALILNQEIKRMEHNFDNFRYLEIGIYEGFVIESVMAQSKIGVDPFPKCKSINFLSKASIIKKSSDNFFETENSNIK